MTFMKFFRPANWQQTVSRMTVEGFGDYYANILKNTGYLAASNMCSTETAAATYTTATSTTAATTSIRGQFLCDARYELVMRRSAATCCGLYLIKSTS